MLKQLSYALAAAALMGTTLASCSSDEPGLLNADGNVTFSVQLPADMATRADNTGTGLSATRLTAAVYQTGNGTTTCVSTKTATFSNLTSQVEFQLVKGATYKIVFFADAQTNSPYSFDTNTGTMSLTYPNSYAETNDCFYKALDVNVSDTYTGEAVTLTRPVAQLNLGTDDLTQALAAGVYSNGVTVKSTVKGVANSLNLLTGEATGTVNAESTATMNDTYAGLNFPYEPTTYSYLAMGYYLLPGQVSGTTTSGTYDCEFQLMNGTTNVGSPIISSATPMQANYRTNIYGALLTKGVIYDVTIDPIFGGEWNNGAFVTWDGTKTAVTIPATPAPIVVNTPAELAYLAEYVNQGNNLKGYTITLSHNFDLTGQTWTPIGSTTANAFEGTLDGNYHTIKGLTASNGTKTTPAALIGWLNGTVKNLAAEDVNLSGVVAALIGETKGSGNVISNCQVLSGTVSGSNNAAGIIGKAYQPVTVSNCTNAATVNGTSNDAKVGGIASIVSCPGASSFTDCVNNGAITGMEQGTAGIIGMANSFVSLSNCSNTGDITNTDLTSAHGEVAGLVASVSTAGNASGITAMNCNNSGVIKGNRAGGIVGRVDGNYQANLTGCTNTGAVTGSSVAGGIISAYGQGTVQNCSNSAAVKATSQAAKEGAAGGVVGAMTRSAMLKNCAGGQAAITAKYAGRLLGSGDNADRSVTQMPCIWIADNNDSYTNLPTIGVMNLFGQGNNNGVYTIMTGTLHGNTPVMEYGTAAGGHATYKIVMQPGTTWTQFPNAAANTVRTYSWNVTTSVWEAVN